MKPTPVVFRVWKEDGSILALFPTISATYTGLVQSYESLGGHAPADYSGCITRTHPATPEEYNPLKTELERNYRYNLKVYRRRPV